MKTKLLHLLGSIIALALLTSDLAAAPLGTAFTYQGRLNEGGTPANGSYDLTFTLYDDAGGGTAVAGPLTNSPVGVTNGLFTVTLDFGSSVFSGDARWLEIAVRSNGGGAFTPLTPRQQLSPAPYARYAPSAGLAATATTAGTASSVVAGSIGTDALAPGAVDSSRIAGGGIAASNLNAAVLSNTFWRLDGNAGTTPGTHLLGTTDNQPLQLRVNGAGALRLEPTTNAPNVIGGSSGNYMAPGVVGAAIAGGGNPATPSSNRIFGSWSFIGGGTANEAGSPRSVVAGGVGNVIEGGSTGVAIGGGSQNLVQSNSLNAHLGGGSHNTIQSNASVATIGGGGYNLVRSNAIAATIPGGFENEVAGSYGFAAGRRAKADHPGAFVWADSTLTPAGFASTGTNQFLIRAGGGVGIGTNNPQSALHVAGTVTASAFVGRGALPWLEVTGTSQSASPNVAYLANSATQVVVTLPVAPTVGDIVRVSGLGAGGWRIAQNDGQSILTENIGGIGTVWTPHESNRMWSCVASSADGTRLAATVNDSLEGRIYLSADSGATWIASGPTQAWLSVACSADGAKLVAIPWYGQLHTSDDYGTNWTARDIVREWRCVGSSADGNKLIAVPNASFILTSTNSGVSWTPIETNAWWNSVALSADGNIIYAAGSGPIYMSFDFGANWYAPGEWNSWSDIACSADGSQVFASAMYLYTSTNYGFGWTAHGDNGSYRALTCSADGTRAVAVDGVGRIYTSADSGLTWMRRLDGMYNWWTVASSADGSKLVATGNGMQIYTSVPTTTPGPAGYLAGGQGSEIQLQYLGNGQFRILNSEGTINLQGAMLPTGLAGAQAGLQSLQAGLDTKVSKAGDTMTGPLINNVVFAGNGGGLTNITGGALVDGSITGAKIAAGTVASANLANGAVGNAQLIDGALTPLKLASVTNFNLLTTFTNPTPILRDYFGNAMAGMGSDRVLIGDGLNGFAYLFATDGVLLTTFNNPTPVFDGDAFGHALASLGNDRLIIGAHLDDSGAANSGAAYLFSTNGTLLTTFTNPTPAANDYFGFSVAVVGSDGVLIGAYNDGAGANAAGAAYLFRTNGTLLTTFTNPTPAFDGEFGYCVAPLGNDRVLIGAHLDDTSGHNSGVAYLFSTNGTMLITFTNPAPALGGSFGISVAAVGSDRVLISASSANAAYLFTTNGALLAAFTNPTPASLDLFGLSMAALGNDRVLIAAQGDDTGATDAGAAYLFGTDGSLLASFTGPTPAANGHFGVAVAAIGSDRVLIGGFTNGGNNGAAYLYRPETYAQGLMVEGVRQGAITSDSLAEHAVTPGKLALGAVTSNSIASGQVVRRINGLADVVTLAAGPNVTITPSGNTLQIAAAASTNGVAAWGLTGNSNTLAGVNFLGTTDNQPLELRVNGQRALRLETGGGTPNVIGGFSGNYAGANVVGATIGGGGMPRIAPAPFSLPNVVNASYGSILGGYGNTVAGYAAAVAGGEYNSAEGDYSFAAGRDAHALHEGSFVWADATSGALATTKSNQFLIRASGGVGINSPSLKNYGYSLAVQGNTYLNGYLRVQGNVETDFGLYADVISGTTMYCDTADVNRLIGYRVEVDGGGLHVGGDADFNDNLDVFGNLSVHGFKLAAVETSQGQRGLHAEESAQAWFTDYGFGRLVKGHAVVQIDPLFSETVNLNEPYHVFVQVNDPDCEGAAIVNKTATSFEVRELRKGKSDADFSYRVVGLRRGCEKFRLDPVPEPKHPAAKSAVK